MQQLRQLEATAGHCTVHSALVPEPGLVGPAIVASWPTERYHLGVPFVLLVGVRSVAKHVVRSVGLGVQASVTGHLHLAFWHLGLGVQLNQDRHPPPPCEHLAVPRRGSAGYPGGGGPCPLCRGHLRPM